MSQTNVREGYRITTLEVIELIEDLTTKVRQYSAKVKTEDLSNTPTPTLSKTTQQRSSSVVSNRSIASITNKFSVTLLTKPAILNNANIALVDAVHHSVIDALTMTLIKNNNNLLGTVNSHIKLRRLRAVMLLCQTTKPLGDSNKVTFQPNEPLEQPSPPEQPLLPKKRGRHSKLILDRPPLKRRKTEAADSRHAKASRGRTKKDKDSEDSNTSSDVPRSRRRDRAAARAQSAKRKQLEKEAQLKKTKDEEELAKAKKEKEEKEAQERKTYSSDINPKDNSEDEEATTAKDLAREQKERLKALLNANCDFTLYQLTDAYILYFKELLSNNSRIFANAISIGKTRAIVLATEVQNAQAEGDATEHNAVNNDDKLCPTKGERTFHCADPLALQFCFFSNSPPENIGRPTKEEAIEMQINTTNAISKALAAANKLVAPQSYTIPEANTPAVHPKATKHRPAPSAAQFIIVCSFRKVDKHVFRAYNTISITAQRTIIRKGSPHIEKRAILLPSHITFNATNKRDSVTGDRIYKIEDAVYRSIAETLSYRTRQNTALNSLAIAKQYRRIIFNRFKMQAIAFYPTLTTLKAAQFKTYSSCKVKRFTSNSVKDLFTNLSKDYFLSIAAEDAAKAANTPPPPKEVRAKILIGSYKPIVQALAEMYISIVYFNPDSKLELKVLGKQDVKTTSRDKLQGRGSTVTDQRID
ncbi:hypothetical protein HBH49_072420 [Parastagonospora nodorum]|nr:hypothetical protein HBH49_072420 [Parastagonospora nodorum]